MVEPARNAALFREGERRVDDLPLTDHGTAADNRRMDLEPILRTAVERGASDVHLKAGRPPVMRYDGDLQEMEEFGVFDSMMLEHVLDEIGALTPRRVAH